ncbi:MAG: CopY family transcriptional repressor [Bacteroidetes bacterium]|nr:MAG: CopY family transcriptional repressor [Bacteroidota bacterium]
MAKELTKAEEDLMQHLWTKDKSSVKELLNLYDEPKPAINTVSTIIRILEQKGFVSHEVKGRGFIYFPLISKEEYKNYSLRKIMGAYFEGSLSKMVSFFVEKEKLDHRELEDILNIINQNKGK